MENFTQIVWLILAIIFSGLLMVSTNGAKDTTSFGSRMTDKEYPIFVYIFIGVMFYTAYFILFKLKI